MLSITKTKWSRFAAFFGLFCCALVASLPQDASAQGVPLIRDTEIENVLNDYAQPLFKAAGFGAGRIRMRIVQSDAFNAFVLDGKNVFVHTGTLMQANTPNEVIGVIAHETGHITGGHMAALRARIAKDQTRALLAQILGIGLMVAGGVSGSDSLGGAGQGVMFGGNEVIMRSLLAERRQQESAADQAGLTLLNATRQSGRGMLTTFERFAAQEYISDAQKEAFARSHPLSTDRLARLRKLVETSPHYGNKDSAELQLRHDLMRAKLSGYLEKPQTVFNRYPATDNSLPARYARALARFFQGGPGALDAAMAQVDGLLATRPDYPYFWEVKGDLLMRSGRTSDAIAPLRQALKLAPNASLIRVQLAGALQETQGEQGVNESITLLRKSLIEDENPRAYRLLANSYYKMGRRPEADAMIAQAYFLEGNLKQAQLFAKRAQTKLRQGTPEWLKNDDIINYKPQT
ncbi:M48 family metalloprotease [Hyphomicrobium sulfonivorans]|uniref:Putative Zn-dependent protease n=1 Tax=Hyphomicrobium sulfonivorans TaxID=121290 RepID=A0A109BK60_HYPSL|nr:M48 family metalloprotease [Hyphomicrobium sulfonivorans]KWT69980.1 putative Zn-dependent protease [Hyphomicrobium sulfonivorans]MBI1649004.1 M48 family metallopeptidase [Hyphomicrobium sulfonivorans]NSL70461.1 M48 family peptidase [Hyphomicrobium sulfonivorans]